MIKIIIGKYECPSCGSKIDANREVVIDRLVKKIEIPKPTKCICGRKKEFILLDCELQ